jgi:PAB1-binding protein PBP1
MAKKLSSSGKQSNGITDDNVGDGPDRTLTLDVKEVVDCKVDGVRLDKSQARSQNGEHSQRLCLPCCSTNAFLVGASSNFRTDIDISSRHTVRERDLQKWEPANDSPVDMSLDNGRLGDWDQFAAHKQLTGLDSTYDENHYTTKLDTSAPGFKDKYSKADRIAREIEGSTTTNAHQAEERGLKAPEDSGVDEETK